MKCKVCNAELTENQSFCPYCGTKVEAEEVIPPQEQPVNVTETTQPPVQNPTSQKNPADTHALVGFILGICSFVCCCIGLPSGIVGIIFSAKGLKSTTRNGLAIAGLVLSILALVNFLSFWFGFSQGITEGFSEFYYGYPEFYYEYPEF